MGCLQGGKVACREDGLPAVREGCLQGGCMVAGRMGGAVGGRG